MLSWSGNHDGDSIDLTSIESGEGLVGERADLLWRFASACGGTDDAELDDARSALVEASDVALMVDAAAVAANFEMMTRLADSTGAKIAAERVEAQGAAIGALGMADVTSRR